MVHTPLHSPHPGEQSRPALRHEHFIVEQLLLQKHFTISSKTFGATSLSVIIGIKVDPQTFQPQSIGGRLNPLHACTWW